MARERAAGDQPSTASTSGAKNGALARMQSITSRSAHGDYGATLQRAPAMKNGRCRMHRGKAGGRPTHGRYTLAAIAERRRVRMILLALRARTQ